MKRRSLLFFLAGLVLLAAAGYAALSIMSDASDAETGGVPVRISLATDAFLRGYGEYLDLSWFEEGDQRIAFSSNMLVRNFSILALGYDDGFYVERVLLEQKELLPDRPIVISWTEQAATPQRGISFLGEDGETRNFVFGISQEEGEAFFLLEF